MTRQKIEIKKIENITTRQVTFSKRRRGLFKKALELSTLCDAEIALMVFSSTGKLYEFASSSMQQVIERRCAHTEKPDKQISQPSVDPLECTRKKLDRLKRELEAKTMELKNIKGDDLECLDLEDIKQLEATVEKGLRCVSELKDQKALNEISFLKRKGVELAEDNHRLQQLAQKHEGMSMVESIIDDTTNLEDTHHNTDDRYISDTTLKLGLPGETE